MLAKEGFDPTYGARPLRRAAVKLIEEPLAQEMLAGRVRHGDRVQVSVQDGRLIFNQN